MGECYLRLHASVSTDVEAVEDDVQVSGGGGHEEEEEVVVRVRQQALRVDHVQQGLLPQRKLVCVLDELRVDL